MADGCLSFGSEDAALVALGNALLLNALVANERHRAFMKSYGSSRLEDSYKSSRLATESGDLRDALGSAGALDLRIEGPEDISGTATPESLDDWRRRISDLVSSDADIATLRLRDFPFPRWMLNWSGVRYDLETADPYELRVPLATGYISTELLQALSKAVICYFRGEVSDAAPIFPFDLFADPDEPEPAETEDDARSGGPLSGAEIGDRNRAKAALRDFAATNPGRRMKKRDFCDALVALDFSRRGAIEVWDGAAPPAWRSPGQRSKNTDLLLTTDDLEPYLQEVNWRVEGRGSVSNPSQGSGRGDDLVKPTLGPCRAKTGGGPLAELRPAVPAAEAAE